MPNAPVPVAAPGLPTLTPDQTIDLDAEAVEVERCRIHCLRGAIAAHLKVEDALFDTLASGRADR